MNHLFLTLGWSLVVLGLSACAGMTGERIVYDQQGVQVGIQSDPTISRSSPPARNSHPATVLPNELRLLLRTLQISGLVEINCHPVIASQPKMSAFGVTAVIAITICVWTTTSLKA